MARNEQNLPEDVQRIKEKAQRGEELTQEEAGTLGGHGISLDEMGVEEPSDKD